MMMQKTTRFLAVLAVGGMVAGCVAAAQLWSTGSGSREALVGLCAGLLATIRTGPLMTEVPLMDDGGGGGSTGSAPSDSSSAGNSQGGASSCLVTGTVQGRGGFGLFSGGSGNGDEDPDKRPTENKPLGGCSSDDGVCAGAQEEQLADQSAGMELVPGTSKGRWKAYKERTVDLDVGRDAGVMGPQARPVIQYQPFPPLDLSRQQVNPNPYGNSDQAFDGEEWQGQRDVRNKRPPPTPPGFPQQVTSPGPSEEMQKPKQMVGTPSRGKMVLPPIPMMPQPHMPLVQEETAQLLVYPPDETDWAAAEQHGQTHIPVVVESIDTAPLVGMPITQATDLVAQQLAAAGFDPNHEFVLAMVVVLDDCTKYIPLGGNQTMQPYEETGVIAAVHKDKVYSLRDMYSRRVGKY